MMMMGFGGYGNGGGGGGGVVDGSSSSSSSSNLSPLAQPFTVDRSVPKPLVDLTEPPLNWLNTHSISFDSMPMPSSNAYGGYSFTSPAPPPHTTDTFLYGQPSDAIITSLVEAKPYYPSYVSPTKFSYDDYTQTLSGLWEGSRGWDFAKKVEIADPFASKDMNVADFPVYNDYLDQGGHSSKVQKTCEEQSHMLGSAKHLGSDNREQFDYKSYPGQNTEFMPVEYSRKSFLGSTSVFPEIFTRASSSDQVRSRNHQMPYGTSYEKGVKQYDNSPSDITSVRNASPGLVIRSPVGSVSSAPNTSAFNNVEIGSIANNIEFSRSSNFSNTNDFHPIQSSEGKVRFDSNQVGFHLERDNHSFPELSLQKHENFLGNISVTKDPFKENSGLQVPHISPGGMNLTLDGSESINRFENSTESLDHYNPAVDSPCWKARDPHYSPLETSASVIPQLTKTIEAYSGSNFIGPTNNAVKFSSQKPCEFSLNQGNVRPENDLAPSPERLSVSNLFREFRSHDDVKEGPYHMNSSFGIGFQLSDDIEKPKEEFGLSKKSICEFNTKPRSMQQSLEEVKLTSEKKCESGTSFAGVAMNNSDSSEGCSSHVPFHATEHVLDSPCASVEATPAKVTKLLGEELAPKICVQTVINTMHNLSELLLFHCSNEASVLMEQDLAALKNVVNNLDKCILKNLAPVVTSQESSIPEATSQLPSKSPELHEGVTMSRPQGKKPEAVAVLNQSDYQCIEEKRKHSIMSDKLDESISDFASGRGYADSVKDDKMTQAIKKILSENFSEEEGTQEQILLYKNLWLEAEAALCSIGYRARFNRMKIEMEKCKPLKAKVGADLSKNNVELQKQSQSAVSSDLNIDIKLKPEVNDDSCRDISVPVFLTMTTSSHPDDVMARFHILKCQVEGTRSTIAADVEKLSSSNASPDLNKFDKMTSETMDEQTGRASTAQDSPVHSPTGQSDNVEASVMARFQILKNRADNSSCSGILDVNLESVEHPEDKLTLKEFHLQVKDDPVIPFHRLGSVGNKLPAAGYDSSSSDWEHVLKEELAEQNC